MTTSATAPRDPPAIDVDDEATWPSALCEFLDRFVDTTEDREALDALLRAQHVVGYHCARLTESEILRIRTSGMGNGGIAQRLLLLAAEGALSGPMANELISNPWLYLEDDSELWFFFSPPHEQGEFHLGTFLRCWGGYRHFCAYRDDPEIGPILRGIGTPCVVVADVPVAALRSHQELSSSILWRFHAGRGGNVGGPPCDGCLARPLAAEHIRSIVRFPDRKFVELTKCDEWHEGMN